MSRGPLPTLLAAARPVAHRFAGSALCGALASASAVALMGTSGYLISRAALRPQVITLAVAITAVRAFSLSRAAFRYAERLISHDASLRLLRELRVRWFRRLEPLVPAGLPGARCGDLLSGFVADVEAVQHLYLRGIAPPLVALTVGAGSVAATMWLLPAAGLWLALGLLPAALALPAASVALTRAAASRRAAARAERDAETVELLHGAPDLIAFDRMDDQLGRIRAADAALATIARRDARTAGFTSASVTLLTAATTLAVLVAGLHAVHHNGLPGVLLAALALAATAAFEAVRPLPAAAADLLTAHGAAARLGALTGQPPPVVDPVHPLPPPTGALLRVHGVRVRHTADSPWVLDGIDLDLRPGRRVALLGPSGAGKSTLAHLLVRFRDPDHGTITLDGHDLRAYEPDDVRRTVCLIDQHAHLFDTTIRANVALAKPDATETELIEALRRARVWDWITTLPAGLDTHLGEHGARVSGGQRQRIALARAFLSGARLLILDEPTAHLDAATAHELLTDILGDPSDTGILLIIHTPPPPGTADQILHLTSGRLHEVAAETARPR
ncbi:thiol reductant ABC exporter subunit CydC [Actinomadura verrucosospora]|uniref:Putative ABC transporter ATP-binding protein/permease n=1 Tax=Actinomadura verrucosospora TaxID=46165 RepID=A0A7D4AGM0_ACTVE|nr:thiol reductant ABC exporter subunit CydC [Actinomadura verrucosospora]QKG18748.1 putative ABC transporter ATP-binding protein/permease [Actinomadura verrucosospora]